MSAEISARSVAIARGEISLTAMFMNRNVLPTSTDAPRSKPQSASVIERFMVQKSLDLRILTCKLQVIAQENLPFASEIQHWYATPMIYEPKQCPVRYVMGVFGDRWSLLIIRDMMFRGSARFQDFLKAGEGISTNILSDRLSRLEAQEIITRQRDPANGRQVLYELTDKGSDLLPVMLAAIEWAEKYDPETDVSHEFAERVRTDMFGVRDEMLDAMRKPAASPDSPRPIDLITGAPDR